MDQNFIHYLLTNWGKLSIVDIQKFLAIDLYTLLQIAYQNSLYTIETANIGRRWTREEDQFLEEYANRLSIPQASNLLYRSRYAIYQRAKLLQLSQMINKRP